MKIFDRKEPLQLFVGDLLIFIISLYLALTIRNQEIPSFDYFYAQIVPFGIIFILWIIVFYIAGLYDKYTTILKDKIPSRILNSLIANGFIAITFFYLIPYFGVSPKTILFIDLIITFILIYIWRIYTNKIFGKKNKELAVLLGSGEEMKMLEKEASENPRLALKFTTSIDLNKIEGEFFDEFRDKIYSENIKTIVIDIKDKRIEPVLPHLYNLIFSGVRFFNFDKVYEDIFEKIPLSLLSESWFLENISGTSKFTYDFFKRMMDILISIPLLILSFLIIPFAGIFIKLEDGGDVFIIQNRIGKDNKPIRLFKLRSMKVNDGGVWPTESDERITRVGKFLRKTRIDELPQLWNVIKGDISLIGPRPDIEDLGKKLSVEIPYYNIRNIIKPGLSGWAQIRQEIVPHSLEETRNRLAYDLFYLKNRSFILDLKIALKTIKELISRKGK